ncbi:cysteine desulfurase family protein [Sporosarcina sp. HYO08]|uniref:cysteine desulfurase family protein n=1 Tax=Sporosarcina sp. HYO08 TaxID=1759557 RepID=UPI0007976BE1|nr:cysteine desulfurase family protein [Sporosarcina sp. HYO08]KXH87174.1 aminotransferase class V [Sporosarcina sp. HYO08]
MIYFDNSATTQLDDRILQSYIEVNKRYYANPASLHLKGKEAEALLERSRAQILSILGAPNGEVIFTSGGTEANNLAVIGLAKALQSRGNHLITSKIEHPSILRAMEYLEAQGFEVDYLPVNTDGVISIEDLEAAIRKDTIVVSIMHVNNEIGAVQPIEAISQMIKQKSRAVFHSDAVQSFGKLPIQLDAKGPDMITISAHKIHGLKGSGLLAMKKGVIPHAINFGGGQEKGLRSGTVSVPDAVSLAKSIRLNAVEEERKDFRQWRNQLIQFVDQYVRKDQILVLAPEQASPHILTIAFQHIKGEVAVNFFQEKGITLSTSSACSSKSGNAGHVIEALGIPQKYKNGVIRISFGNMNSDQQIEEFKKILASFMELLGRGQHDEVE